jgi:flagellar protein FlaJ
MKFSLSFENKILLLSLSVSIVLILLGILSSQPGVIGNFIVLSVFITTVPQFFLRYKKYTALKEMEIQFPVFLRDIIESLRSGMAFHQAIMVNSKSDYGKLSEEVKKMAYQLSWGISFNRVIDQFSERIKSSKRLNNTIKIIKESYFSGGDVVSTLESVADATTTLSEIEKEKKSLLSQYVMLMYVIAFLFVGIVAAINKLMIPIFQVNAPSGVADVLSLKNPCSSCYGFTCQICNTYTVIVNSLYYPVKVDSRNVAVYYTALFFLMSIMVSVSCGLVAGQISENSIIAGVKHSLVMTVSVVGAFYILVQLKLLGI